MKKTLLLIVFCLLLFITGCVNSIDDNSSCINIGNSNQIIDITYVPYEREWLQNNLSKIGSENLYIGITKEWNITTNDLKPRFVYLLCDSGNYGENNICHDSYLVVETDSKILFKDIAISSYGDSLYVCDVDGDEIDEIILQQTVGMTGGAGQHSSYVFKVVNDEIQEVFNSSTADLYDTGFTSCLKNDFKLEVQNKFTGYVEILDFGKKSQYIGVYFNEIGKVICNATIWCDSFREFIPTDIDNDGIFEITCLQYVSLYSHADYIGDAKSVLKFNCDTQKFEVLESEFIQVK